MQELISEFVDLCGARGLDPVEALALLNAQDWSRDDDNHISAAGLTIHDGALEDDPVMLPAA